MSHNQENINDPITSEVIRKAFQNIAEEMGVTLIRTAYSTNIKERRDCSCAVFSPQGELISLAEHIPIHLGSMLGLMKKISRENDQSEFHSGDVIIANDPYLGGGSHLPDVTLIRPVFDDKDLVAFAANIAHWSDVGGSFPGAGTAGASTEIYQEGFRLPPIWIQKKGRVEKELLDFILSNMRGRGERTGDFRAQLSSLKQGEKRLRELFRKFGKSTINRCLASILNYSERRLRLKIQEIPEGEYSFHDYMDDDGISGNKLTVKVRISVHHGKNPSIVFNFEGTSPQAEGGINMVMSALEASVYYTVKAVIAPDIPINAGFQRPIQISAPKGSLVNAGEPAAVGGRTDTCQRVVDVIMGALSRAIPEKVTAASNGATTALVFGGSEKLSGRNFVYVEALGGGMGARFNKDGLDGVQVHITNTSNLPIEAMETEYPLRVLFYGLVKDSGGPGKNRGGLAIRKDILALAPVIFSAHSDRNIIPPWGLNGGLPGKTGLFLLNRGKGRRKKIPSKITGLLLKTGDVLSVRTAGGGGYGSPLERQPEKVLTDFETGKISRTQAKKVYGVLFKGKRKINREKTDKLRQQMKNNKRKSK